MTRRAVWGAAAALAIGLGAACGDDGSGTATGRVMGTLRDTANVAQEGITVVLRVAGTGTFVAGIATNPAGAYDFPGTATGSYDIHVTVPPAMQLVPPSTSPTTVSVTTGGTVTADFSLRYLPVSLNTHVQPILAASCTTGACHGNVAPVLGMDLSDNDSTYLYTVNVVSAELGTMDRIEPGNTATSYLIHKINGTQGSVGGMGSTMPFGLPQLPLQSRRLIARWVTEGALNN